MSGIDFSKYPIVDGLIAECDMEHEREHILWLQANQSEAAVLLAEMHLMCQAGISDSITLRNHSKVGSHHYFNALNHKVHVFASNQALNDLGLSEKDLLELFAHKEGR